MTNIIGHMTNYIGHYPRAMLEPLFESEIKEKVLLYIHSNGESYPREISRAFQFNLYAVQYQMLKLEKGGVLYSKLKGKVRLFGFNPRYPFKEELEALLEKVLSFYPEDEKTKFFIKRLRPRRAKKPF
jgi:hypothetical protein